MSDINLDGFIFLIILVMVGPAILFAIIGGILRYNQKKKAGKVFFILSAIYLVISLGICSSMMLS